MNPIAVLAPPLLSSLSIRFHVKNKTKKQTKEQTLSATIQLS